ncbi:uncharacterized protein LOC127864886 [Dreissena polymorpha]|uniref:uncharacterized protein LOC127864886 n=1 Tax=Dreissena polymorpha TaxID=45954 RepID=UPI0022647C51|nr:uncharacterized protein LOC127864886 [Dreissena polymorpha]
MDCSFNECGVCASESVVAFCENCNFGICETCFQNHKKPTKLFQNHVAFVIDLNQTNIDAGRADNQSCEAFKKISDDIHTHKCDKHPTENLVFFCEEHTETLCGRCIYSSHKSCKLVDLFEVTVDDDEVSACKAQLKSLAEILNSTDNRIEQNTNDNNACKLEFLNNLQKLRTELITWFDRLRIKCETQCSETFETYAERLTQVRTFSQNYIKRIQERQDLIDYLQTQNHVNKLYLLLNQVKQEIEEVKSTIKGLSVDSTFNGYVFKRSSGIEDLLNAHAFEIGGLEEWCSGSDEISDYTLSTLTGSRLGTEAEHSGALDGKNDTPTVDSKSEYSRKGDKNLFTEFSSESADDSSNGGMNKWSKSDMGMHNTSGCHGHTDSYSGESVLFVSDTKTDCTGHVDKMENSCKEIPSQTEHKPEPLNKVLNRLWRPMELHASEPLSRIVIIEGIQSGTSESSLREQLLDFLNKYNLQLVFLETANEAHALCNTDSDAKSLLKEKLQNLKTKPHPQPVVENYSYSIGKDTLKHVLLIDFLKKKKFTQPYFTYNEDQGILKVTSPTMYGIQYIKWSLDAYEFKSYKNITELKYELLMAKHGSEILGVGKTDGEILFNNGSISLVCRKSCVQPIDTYIIKLLQCEGEKEWSLRMTDLTNVDKTCEELVGNGCECMVTKQEEPRLIVMFQNYDDVNKVTQIVSSFLRKNVMPTRSQRSKRF